MVVGDAALQSGLTLEALNHLGHVHKRLLIVLNDNEMSISPSVGGLSTRLNKLRLTRVYQETKEAPKRTLPRVPVVGRPLFTLLAWAKEGFKRIVGQRSASSRTWGSPTSASSTATTSRELEETFERAFALDAPGARPRQDGEGPRLRAGRAGQRQLPRRQPAADRPDPHRPHRGAAPDRTARRTSRRPTPRPSWRSSSAWRRTIERICAITAGMPTGTGLSRFARALPDALLRRRASPSSTR